MQNNKNQGANLDFCDTSPENVEQSVIFSKVSDQQNEHVFTDNNEDSSQNKEISRTNRTKIPDDAENSIINTNISVENKESVHNQISDTSSKMVDPLSVNDFECKQISNDENQQNLLFNKLFPGVSIEKIQKDELFCLFSSHNGKSLTISELYTNYLRLINSLEGDFAKKALISAQNKLSSPGALSSSDKGKESFFTKEQVLKMTPKEIAQYYNIIRQSQQKW